MYVQGDTLLLTDVFENFRNMCLEIYEFDPAKFLSDIGLAWQASLKKTKIKLNILTDIDILTLIEKGIKGGTFNAIYWYAKANNKFMKICCKNKESSYLNYGNVNNLYGLAMSQKPPVNHFKWIEETS